MAPPLRRLPVLYGGHDGGPRPATRERVGLALEGGVDPVVVGATVAAGMSELWASCLTALGDDAAKPACTRGCSHCCHQRVEVTAPEAFWIARWLAGESPARLNSIGRAAERHARLTSREHFLRQVACPFLDADGACSIYEVRPIACRRAHSLDVATCRRLALDPSLDAVVPASEALDWNTSALVLGYFEGLAHAGQPPHQYELVQAVSLALAPDAERRWRAGEEPLARALTRRAETLPGVLGSAG